MKNKELTTYNDIINFISTLEYGSNTVKINSLELFEMVKNCESVVNIMAGYEILSAKPFVEDYIDYSNGASNGEYKQREIENEYNFLWRSTTDKPPLLKDDDVNIIKRAKDAVNNKALLKIDISAGMFKHAKRIANDYGIKFKAYPGAQCFDGREKKLSVSSRLQTAILNNDDSVEFDATEINVQSVRVYVSQINVINQTRYSVHMKGNTTIVVSFKEQPLQNIALMRAERAFANIAKLFGDELTKRAFRTILDGKEPGIEDVPTEEEPYDPIWDELEKEVKARDIEREKELLQTTGPAQPVKINEIGHIITNEPDVIIKRDDDPEWEF